MSSQVKDHALEPLTMKLNISDWRQAVRNPPAYRIGNSTVRLQSKFVCIVATAGVAVLLYFSYFGLNSHGLTSDITLGNMNDLDSEHGHTHLDTRWPPTKLLRYNKTYPLSRPVTTARGLAYKVYIVTDLDMESKSKTEQNTWESHLRSGLLSYNPRDRTVSLDWTDDEVILKSGVSNGGRGMELSELIVFNGKMYTVDDRTGIIYEVSDLSTRAKPVPWVILSDGNGHETKGFKSEWATVKNQELYVGGLGKEWTTSKGEPIHLNPQWVKVISPDGIVRHVDWHENYERLKHAADIKSPGYMIHEAVVWSDKLQRWIFLPRRASPNRYDEKDDEHRGTNLFITATEDFGDIQVRTVGEVVPTHGFSSCKFIPDTDDRILVALKSEEDDGQISSYAMVFDLNGNVLLPEQKIGNYKFEGIEFG